MLNNLNAKFNQLGKVKFLTFAALLSFLCDAINIVYMLVSYLPMAINEKMLSTAMMSQGSPMTTLSITEIAEIRQLLVQTFAMIFIVVLVIHSFIYFLLARDNRWSKNYVAGYSIIGAVMTLFMLPSMVFQLDHYIWALVMFGTTFIYLFVYLGLRHWKKAATAPEKIANI